jgi:hypothetical protein
MKTSFPPALLRLLGAALFATASAACSGVADTAPATPAAAAAPVAAPAAAPAASPAPAGLMQQIQAEVGDAACDTTAQCKTVAIGHKACGGPESYLPYSTKRSDGAKIERLATALAAERKTQDTKTGRMSTCSLVVDPGATCNAGRCVAGGGNAAF